MTDAKTYVLDTSVLIADPKAFTKFEEHDVVLPVVVLDELEAKRHDPVRGFYAREAIRLLEQARVASNDQSLDTPCPVNDDGGTVRVEMNHQSQQAVPEALRGSSNDHRIISVAVEVADEHPERDVVLVTKDLPLRLRASLLENVDVQEYLNEQVRDDWTGLQTAEDITDETVQKLYDDPAEGLPLAVATNHEDFPANTFLTRGHGNSGLFRVFGEHGDRTIRIVPSRTVHGKVTGRSAEQTAAIELLTDPQVKVVSLGGPAGTGKTFISTAAALEALNDPRSQVARIIFVRPLNPVGQQSLGYLPGDADEKFEPWTLAVRDSLDELLGGRAATDREIQEGRIEMMPVTYLRGRSINNAFIVVDEAQQHEYGVLRTILSRTGMGSKVALTHDVSQRDNLHVGRYDGVAAVVAKLKDAPNHLFGHIQLTKTERSDVAQLVNERLDDGS